MESKKLLTAEMCTNIELVMKLLKNDTSFDGKNVGELLIIVFLNTNSCDAVKAKDKISKYFKYKKQYPKLSGGIDLMDDHNQFIYQQCIFTLDANREESESPFVGVINMSNAKDVTMYDLTKYVLHVAITAILQSERIRSHGLIAIYNFENLPLTVLLQMTPSFLVQFINMMECVVGGLLKKIIIINAGMILAATMRTIRALLPDYLNDILTIYQDSWDCLKTEIPSTSLPIEFGGCNGTAEENNKYMLPLLAKCREAIMNNF